MAALFASTNRFDPYKNFKFQVRIDGTTVAALQKCSALKKTTEVIDWRESQNSSVIRKLTGRTSYADITLEQGITHNPVFEDWANRVNLFVGLLDSPTEIGGTDGKYRKNIEIYLRNEQGEDVIGYEIYRAWVSEYQAFPDLDSNNKAVAIKTIKIVHEGFRNLGVADPSVEEI